jgi:hypothetical protein
MHPLWDFPFATHWLKNRQDYPRCIRARDDNLDLDCALQVLIRGHRDIGGPNVRDRKDANFQGQSIEITSVVRHK